MREVTIRLAAPSDAGALIDFVKELTAEPGLHLITGPGEFRLTLEEEEWFIRELITQENSAIFLAFSGSMIVGEINLRGSQRRALRHSAVLGISVRKGWRGSGVGTLLMGTALDWARTDSSLKRIELNVFVENHAAISLYKKFGFEIEGRRHRSIYREGKYHDDLIMACWLGE